MEQIRRAIESFKNFSKNMTEPVQRSPGDKQGLDRSSSTTAFSRRVQIRTDGEKESNANRLEVHLVSVHNRLAGRVTFVSDKRHGDGTWFDITFDGKTPLPQDGSVTLLRENGQSFEAIIRTSRNRQALVASRSFRPKVGDTLTVSPQNTKSIKALVANR